jgi:DNA-binding phage protein
MTVKSVSYHPSLIERLRNPTYAAAFLNAILEEADPEPDLLKSALRNISEALGDRMEPMALAAHQERLQLLLPPSKPLSIADLMTWLEPFGLRLLVMAQVPSEETAEESSAALNRAS